MHRLRNFPNTVQWLLALTLALAPLLSVWHGGMAGGDQPAAVAAGEHAHHSMAQHGDGQPDQADSGCAQHDSCLGQCCAGCGHCTSASLSVPVDTVVSHSVLTPHVLRLSITSLIVLRERPPRFPVV